MSMIPKTILQTSKHPYPAYVQDIWKQRITKDWTTVWFDDEGIYKFFRDNPLPEFPNIKKVFDSFKDGGHKADLFRYYYLYLNGGFFIDSDVMVSVPMEEIYSTECDHIFVTADVECNRVCHPYITKPIIFNGIMGCVPKSKIIYDALVDAYNTSPELLDERRLHFVAALYDIVERHKRATNILFYEERLDRLDAPYSYTVDVNGRTIAKHFYVGKVIPNDGVNVDAITFFTTFNEEGYKLYGRAWIKTFIHAIGGNRNIRARVYCEGFTPDIEHDYVEYIDFAEAIPEHRTWKVSYLKYTNHMRYTKDMTVRFSHKAFTIMHALEHPSSEYMIWLDGDCIFKAADYTSFATSMVDGNLLACQVEAVKDTKISHVESGILVFDTHHSDKTTFVDTFREFYKIEHIMQMPNDRCDTKETGNWQDYGPYDGFIVHKTLMATKIPFTNLNSTDLVDSPVADPNSTFHHEELNSRFIHNIGHVGKLEYMQLNTALGLDESFEWSHHHTDQLSNLDRLLEKTTETVTANYRGEFPFVIHTPERDTVISGDIYLRGSWEPHIADIILSGMKPNGIFVDIGANIGWHSKIAQNAGYDVIAFEPMPLNYDVLKLNCTKPGSGLYNVGLGDVESTLMMNVHPRNFGDSWIDKDGTQPVKVVRLDDFLDGQLAQRVNVVKMDVQGFETKVIKGGSRFFDSLLPGTIIITEVGIRRPEFDLKVMVKDVVKKASSSYALCYWHDFKPVPLATAISDVKNNPHWDEFDLIIVK